MNQSNMQHPLIERANASLMNIEMELVQLDIAWRQLRALAIRQEADESAVEEEGERALSQVQSPISRDGLDRVWDTMPFKGKNWEEVLQRFGQARSKLSDVLNGNS